MLSLCAPGASPDDPLHAASASLKLPSAPVPHPADALAAHIFAAPAAAAPIAATPQRLAPLPRSRALARVETGLWAAIGNWLRSARRLMTPARPARALMAQQRAPARQPPQGTPSQLQIELIQLRAENRRLREQLARARLAPQHI